MVVLYNYTFFRRNTDYFTQWGITLGILICDFRQLSYITVQVPESQNWIFCKRNLAKVINRCFLYCYMQNTVPEWKMFSCHYSVVIGKSRAACAQSFPLRQQATIEFTYYDHSDIACSRHIYMGVVLRARPVRGESHIQARCCNNIPSFSQRTAPIARSLCEGFTRHDLRILVTAPFCCDRKAKQHVREALHCGSKQQ